VLYVYNPSQVFLVNISHVGFMCILQPLPNIVRGIRESFLGHLTTVLGNDGLAAQFVLLHLLSRVLLPLCFLLCGFC